MIRKLSAAIILTVLLAAGLPGSHALTTAHAQFPCTSRYDAQGAVGGDIYWQDENPYNHPAVHAQLIANAFQQGGGCYYWYRLVMWGTDQGANDDGVCVAGGQSGAEEADAGSSMYVRIWVGGAYQGRWGSGGFSRFVCPQQVTTPAFYYGPVSNPWYGPGADNAGSGLGLDGHRGNAYVNY
jgi:hypothetical protein